VLPTDSPRNLESLIDGLYIRPFRKTHLPRESAKISIPTREVQKNRLDKGKVTEGIRQRTGGSWKFIENADLPSHFIGDADGRNKGCLITGHIQCFTGIKLGIKYSVLSEVQRTQDIGYFRGANI
jgi:hypothetical protein